MVAFDISLLKCKKNPVVPRFQANPVMEISDSYWLSGWTALFASEDHHKLNHILRKNENKILCIQMGTDAMLWLAGLSAELRKSELSHLGKAIRVQLGLMLSPWKRNQKTNGAASICNQGLVFCISTLYLTKELASHWSLSSQAIPQGARPDLFLVHFFLRPPPKGAMAILSAIHYFFIFNFHFRIIFQLLYLSIPFS